MKDTDYKESYLKIHEALSDKQGELSTELSSQEYTSQTDLLVCAFEQETRELRIEWLQKQGIPPSR